MQIKFQLTFDDYSAAHSLHATRSLWSRFLRALARYLFPVFGLCFLVLGVSLVGKGASTGNILTVFACGLYLTSVPFYLHLQLRRCYKRTRTGVGDCTVTFDSERILIDGQNMKSEIDWSAVQSFRENSEIFILYLAPAKFIAVPKRACTAAQIDELQAMLVQRIKAVVRL
jgi:hypothetical protein